MNTQVSNHKAIRTNKTFWNMADARLRSMFNTAIALLGLSNIIQCIVMSDFVRHGDNPRANGNNSSILFRVNHIDYSSYTSISFQKKADGRLALTLYVFLYTACFHLELDIVHVVCSKL